MGSNNDSFGYEEFSLGLLVGLVAGGLMSLLLAPQSGSETRKQIAERATDLKISAEDLLEELRKSVEEVAVKAEDLLGVQKKSVMRKIEKLKAEIERYDLSEA